MRKLLFIHNSADNVAVALADLKAEDTVEVKINSTLRKIKLKEDIPYGHKVALLDIEKGSKVIKYGEVIGIATENILEGSHVHIHNVKSLRY
jgi:altronate dehydratase small subunit